MIKAIGALFPFAIPGFRSTGQSWSAHSSTAQTLSWLMFIATGIGPYSGQAVHFKHFAPKDLEYAAERNTPFIAYKGFGAVTRILN